jgi:hypothetical protein
MQLTSSLLIYSKYNDISPEAFFMKSRGILYSTVSVCSLYSILVYSSTLAE